MSDRTKVRMTAILWGFILLLSLYGLIFRHHRVDPFSRVLDWMWLAITPLIIWNSLKKLRSLP